MTVDKPSDIFDRDWEWSKLTRFVTDNQPGATLGIVSGRRRQGKTFLLESLCEAAGGFYFAALDQVPAAEARRQLAAQLAAYAGWATEPRLDDWDDALRVLLQLGTDRPVPIVLDEFPYLVASAGELPSVIQKVLSPRSPDRRASRARLLLCGSSMSFMGGLLSGNAPLRGRAGLELVIPTFDFRRAREFWEVSDLTLAALLYFVVGGTPAYRAEYLRGAAPETRHDFDAWVMEHVLSPSSPLFREVRTLLAEPPTAGNAGLYHAVLAAVAEGSTTRGAIAGRLERKAGDISHQLNVLQEAGLLAGDPDALRGNRTYYRITEPLVRFYYAIIRPHWTRLERIRPGRTERIWKAAQPTFGCQVAGPVFERMCRVWAEDMAAPETFGGEPERALSGVVYDRHRRTSHELDVVVLDERRQVLAIGETKWGKQLGIEDLNRLQAIRTLLDETGKDPRVLALFSGAGFDDELRARAESSGGRIQLVDLERLYFGE